MPPHLVNQAAEVAIVCIWFFCYAHRAFKVCGYRRGMAYRVAWGRSQVYLATPPYPPRAPSFVVMLFTPVSLSYFDKYYEV